MDYAHAVLRRKPVMPANCTGVMWLALAIAAACEGQRLDRVSERADTALVVLFEGRTGTTMSAPPAYAARLWTAPVLDSLARAGTRAESIAVAPATLRLTAGDSVRVDTLRVAVFDEAGKTIAAAPFVVEGPESLLRAEGGTLVARSPGSGELRVSAMLPATRGRTDIARSVPLTISAPARPR